MRIDFFARRRHFVEHLLPVWNQLPKTARGNFFVPACLENYAKGRGLDVTAPRQTGRNELDTAVPAGDNPIIVCAYGDMLLARKTNPNRQYIMMEHGVGLTPAESAGYAGGLGSRKLVDLFMAPNKFIAEKIARSLDSQVEIIGTPYLDEYENPTWTEAPIENPVIAIGFHWNGSHISPEAGNAWEYYKGILPELAAKYKLLGHGHPKALEYFAETYDKLGIEVVADFHEVMRRADVYVNDCSSTMYEFLCTGKPVVILNAPQFRRDVHWGIRFWDYTDVGPQVNSPSGLIPAIDKLCSRPDKYLPARQRAVHDLYPSIGDSAKLAAMHILEFIKRSKKVEKMLLKVKRYEELRQLLSGANNSVKGISDLELQFLSWAGSQIPAGTNYVEIGTHRGKSICAVGLGVLEGGATRDGQGSVGVYGVDLWQDGSGKTFEHYSSTETWDIFQAQIESMGLKELVKPIKMSSERANAKFRNGEKRRGIGLLFIDAGHKYEDVSKDYKLWGEFVVPGGRIMFHDYGTRFDGVDRTINELVKASGLWKDEVVIGRIWSAVRK